MEKGLILMNSLTSTLNHLYDIINKNNISKMLNKINHGDLPTLIIVGVITLLIIYLIYRTAARASDRKIARSKQANRRQINQDIKHRVQVENYQEQIDTEAENGPKYHNKILQFFHQLFG